MVLLYIIMVINIRKEIFIKFKIQNCYLKTKSYLI